MLPEKALTGRMTLFDCPFAQSNQLHTFSESI